MLGGGGEQGHMWHLELTPREGIGEKEMEISRILSN